MVGICTPLSSSDAINYRRPLFRDPSTGRFTTLDPFAGDSSEPQSLHKYGYCNSDPVNFSDPTGLFSVAGMAVSIAIGSTVSGTLAGAAFGAVNGGWGWATGQMDFQSAVRSFSRSTLLGAGAGGSIALMALQFKFLSLGAAATVVATEVAGGGVALWVAGGPGGLAQGLIHAWYQNPNETIRKYKGAIRNAAQAEGIPPDLLAAVLLAELNDYGAADLLGDDLTLWRPEEHSIGIAQLRIDNVRNWGLRTPEFGNLAAGAVPASEIRAALETDESSIELLAQFVRRAARMGPAFDDPSIGFATKQLVDLSQWNNFTLDRRASIARYFGFAKDDLQGQLVGNGQLQADVTYRRVVDMGLLE